MCLQRWRLLKASSCQGLLWISTRDYIFDTCCINQFIYLIVSNISSVRTEHFQHFQLMFQFGKFFFLLACVAFSFTFPVVENLTKQKSILLKTRGLGCQKNLALLRSNKAKTSADHLNQYSYEAAFYTVLKWCSLAFGHTFISHHNYFPIFLHYLLLYVLILL